MARRQRGLCLQCRRPRFNPWVRKIPWRRPWQPTTVFLPGEFDGQKNLVGCSPWGHKELDMTELLTVFQNKWLTSVQFCRSVMSDSLQPHGLRHARLPCPSPTPRACSYSCPSSWWCHPTISSSVIPFSFCLQSFTASGSFLMSQFFASGGQNIGVSVSASVLPMNIQDWFPLGLTCWISLQSKGLSRFFSNTTVQNHQFFSTQLGKQILNTGPPGKSPLLPVFPPHLQHYCPSLNLYDLFLSCFSGLFSSHFPALPCFSQPQLFAIPLSMPLHARIIPFPPSTTCRLSPIFQDQA